VAAGDPSIPPALGSTAAPADGNFKNSFSGRSQSIDKMKQLIPLPLPTLGARFHEKGFVQLPDGCTKHPAPVLARGGGGRVPGLHHGELLNTLKAKRKPVRCNPDCTGRTQELV